jgi:hypothetical protein
MPVTVTVSFRLVWLRARTGDEPRGAQKKAPRHVRMLAGYHPKTGARPSVLGVTVALSPLAGMDADSASSKTRRDQFLPTTSPC